MKKNIKLYISVIAGVFVGLSVARYISHKKKDRKYIETLFDDEFEDFDMPDDYEDDWDVDKVGEETFSDSDEV